MATTKDEVRIWLQAGKKDGATHVIVVCDTFSHNDYPVMVKPWQDPREVAKKYDGVNMQRLMEVYSLSVDLDLQLAEHRAFHWEVCQPTVAPPTPTRVSPPRPTAQLKLYVWEHVLADHYSGIAFALASSVAEAREAILRKCMADDVGHSKRDRRKKLAKARASAKKYLAEILLRPPTTVARAARGYYLGGGG